jgi:hypothetical protein
MINFFAVLSECILRVLVTAESLKLWSIKNSQDLIVLYVMLRCLNFSWYCA